MISVMETLLSIALGVGLAAACGFRIFVPLLLMSLASRAGMLEPAGGFEWIGSLPALVAFAVATLLEIGAYYVPWLDNALDTLATPAAVVAGVVVTASAVGGMEPLLKWTLAVIAGGGAAGLVQAATSATRGLSSLATGGLGNFLVASGEAVGAVAMSALAILLPLLALTLVAVAALLAARWTISGGFRRRAAPAPSS
jgi:hypothetical protein